MLLRILGYFVSFNCPVSSQFSNHLRVSGEEKQNSLWEAGETFTQPGPKIKFEAENQFWNLRQVRMLLEEPNVEGEPKPFQMARNVYKSCMGKERIEQLGSEPLKKTIMVSRDEFGKETTEMRCIIYMSPFQDLGGWPVLMGANWDGSGYIWYEQGCNAMHLTLLVSLIF